MSAPASSQSPLEAGDPLLARLLRRCAAASVGDAWHLARAWTAPPERDGLVAAALGLAHEVGTARDARTVMTRAARELRDSEGGHAAATRLRGMDVVFRAQAAAQEAALAVVLRDHLSPDLRAALAAPWAAVCGDPLVPEPDGDASPA